MKFNIQQQTFSHNLDLDLALYMFVLINENGPQSVCVEKNIYLFYHINKQIKIVFAKDKL